MTPFKIRAVVSTEGQERYTLTLTHQPVTIGSSPLNDIVLDDGAVRPEHATLALSRGQLVFLVRPAPSRPGAPGEPTETWLGGAGVVRVPPFSLRFELDLGEGHAGSGPIPRQEGTSTIPPETSERKRPRAEAERPLTETAPDGVLRRPAHTVPRPAPGKGPARTGALDTLGKTAPERTGAFVQTGWRLYVSKGPPPLMGKTIDLDRSRMVVGRDPSAEIPLPLQTVSRAHAVFRITNDGSWQLEDLNSRNGTGVNGMRIGKVSLEGGETISFGPDVIVEVTSAPKPEPVSAGIQLAFRRPAGGAPILIADVGGRVDVCTYSTFQDKVRQAIDGNERFLVLSLTKLDFIDHSGLGVLVQLHKRLHELGGALVVTGVSTKLRADLKLNRLDTILTIVPEEASAISDLVRISRK